MESYSFGSTYLSDYLVRLRDSNQAILNCFIFIPYENQTSSELNPAAMSFERNSDYESQAESMDLEAAAAAALADKATGGGGTNLSGSSGRLAGLTKHESMMTGEELDEAAAAASGRAASVTSMEHPLIPADQQMSKKGYRKTKVAQSHHFRTVRTLSKKCKECDVMNFNFQGLECTQVSSDYLTVFCGGASQWGISTVPTAYRNYILKIAVTECLRGCLQKRDRFIGFRMT